MACELSVLLENRPGSLAAMGEALGNAGINIEGICGFSLEEIKLAHILVENASAARTALENAGLTVHEERDVLVLELPDGAGEFGSIFRRLAAAGINANLVYLTAKNYLVLGVDDYNRARKVLEVAEED